MRPVVVWGALALLAVGHESHAQLPGEEDEAEPGFHPSVGIEFFRDDNLYQTSANEQSSWIGVLSPLLLARMERPNNTFEISYEGEFGRYEQSSIDDYDDSRLSGLARFGMGRATQLDFDASFEREHENRGTGLSQGLEPDLSNLPPTPDEYDFRRVRAMFTIGAEGTKGRLVFEVGEDELDYVTDVTRTDPYDRETAVAGARFTYAFRPTLSLLVSVYEAEVDFKFEATRLSSLDNTERRYRLGVIWDNDSTLEGSVLLGSFDRNQRDPFLDDSSGPSWEANVQWAPRTYSTFQLAASQLTQETNGLGIFIDTRAISLQWTHSWSDRLASTVSLFDSEDSYELSARFDDTTRRGIGLSYYARRWIRLESGVEWVSRNSTLDRFAFDETVFRIGTILNF